MGRPQCRDADRLDVWGAATATGGMNVGVWGSSSSTEGYDFFANGAGVNYGAASSKRWKSNIEPIHNPIDLLAQVRGVYFDWDQDHGGHHDVGMIAEEVGAVLPEIVNYEENATARTPTAIVQRWRHSLHCRSNS